MLDQFLDAVNAEAIATQIVEYLPNLVGAIILILVFWILGHIVQRLIGKAFRESRLTDQAKRLLQRTAKWTVIIIGALTVADQLGINVASLIAGVGIVGLALSFAAQDTVGNLISGVAIVIDQPFKEGDWISLGDLHATVTEIRLRTTVLTTFDNETVVVPNQQLAQERVVNYTLTQRIRVRVDVGIAYKEDMQAARDILLKTLEGDNRILEEPAPMVLVTGLGDSSVNLQMRFWVEDSMLKFPMASEYTEKVKRALDEADIEIPFPHLQLFVEESDGVKMLAAPEDGHDSTSSQGK